MHKRKCPIFVECSIFLEQILNLRNLFIWDRGSKGQRVVQASMHATAATLLEQNTHTHPL